MTDEEIKKALVCCLVYECKSCPIIRFHDCRIMLKNETISLLNRQQAEIERLQKYSTEVAFKHYNDGRTEARKEFAAELISALKIDEFSWFEEESERLVKAINELAEGSEIKCQ